MRNTIFFVAAVSAAAVAQPHGHGHHHYHQAKRDTVTNVDMVTEVQTEVVTAPAVVVFVDQYGNPTATSVESQTSPTSSTQPNQAPPEVQNWAPPSSWHAPVPSVYAPPPSSAPAPPPSSAPAPPPPPPPPPSSAAPAPSSPAAASPSSPASSSPPSSGSGSGSGSSGYGIAYSPYNSDHTCKTQEQVNQDFQQINGYGFVRIYGTDCDQTSTVLKAATPKGMKVFAGIYDIKQLDSEVQAVISAVNGNWDNIHTVAVGNEGVNAGTYSVQDAVNAVNSARTKLRAAGYNGPVVTVDTFVAILANPQLCEASDYAAANCHAFFDGGVSAEKAGAFVLGQAQAVSAKCGGKNTIITETGWPHQGSSNGQAAASPSDQSAAISSLKSAFGSNIVLFTAFNDYWKTSGAGQFGAEPYWGILGNAPSG